MRRTLTIEYEGETLAASLDEAPGTVGLLIVSGGNEVRAGAHRGTAMLAAAIATGGTPVLRFDRRGVGDSSGSNGGYASSGPDIAAAAAALRREQPQITRVVGFGNCDAASALALFGREAGIDAAILANPWVVEAIDLPPAAAIRRHYRQRILQPRAWWRLATGNFDLRRLLRGLRRIATPEPQNLADRVVAAIAAWHGDARVVLAAEDATAIAFAAAAASRRLATPIERIATASHSFAGARAAAALTDAIRRAL